MIHVPIHVHSEYSQLDGLSTMREIADRCEELEYYAVGNSDHGTVAGHLDFSKTMKGRGIKPIFACELYHGVNPNARADKKRDDAHFLAGAVTDEGLRNLWRLVDASASNFYHKPRVDWDMLKKYREGLFATSACMSGLVSQGILKDDLSALNQYIEVFGEDFFIELHTYPTEDQEKLNQELVQVAYEKGVPLMVATDAHYARPDQYEVHDAYMALAVRESVYKPKAERKMHHPKGLYIQSVEEIRANLSYLPSETIDEALQNGMDLADRVNADLPDVTRHLPAFMPKKCPWMGDRKVTNAATLFIDLVEEGLIERYGRDADKEVWDRAETELKVFLEGGLEHYFLQAWDFVQFCENKGIRRGPGRGSAGGCIVAYALKITDVDPLHYDLMFERFYNPGRAKGFPDIDNDFPTSKRLAVRKYMMERWGDKRVRTIGTITRMKPKSAIDYTYSPMDITFAEKEELKKIVAEVPDIDIHGPDTIGWDRTIDPGKTIYVLQSTEGVKHDTGRKIIKWVERSPKERQGHLLRWLDVIGHVCSRVSNYGVHPSGTVVSDVDLDAELPCRWSTEQKLPVTMFNMEDVDARQFVKQDFLGLRNLDTLEEWEKLEGEVEWSGMDKRDWPVEMWELLDRGLSLGVFQIEGGYARRLCKEIQPRSVLDLAAIVAMNRPGPIRANVPDRYIARRFGQEDVTYMHPILEPILKETYGLLLYQEQVINFMKAIGYDPSDADEVRKILGKKKPEAMRDLGKGQGEWKGKGYMDVATAAGIPEDVAQEIWNEIEGFASYSFNKSHAVMYAAMAFRTLYAKWKSEASKIISLIITDPEKAGSYVAEGKRMGVVVKAPDILRSQAKIAEVKGGEILFGFSNIKNIGVDTAKFLVKLREKHDLSSLELLKEAIEAEQQIWEEGGKKGKSAKQSLRANLFDALYEAGCWDNYQERNITLQERQHHEKELLQVILTDNTEQIFNDNADRLDGCDDYDSLTIGDAPTGKLPGVIMTIEEKRTKAKREAMGIVTIEFEGDEVEFVVFPREWRKYKFLWKERTPGLFDLKRTDRGLHFASGIKLK
jgi:DNA polymerase-3 subunit alpha